MVRRTVQLAALALLAWTACLGPQVALAVPFGPATDSCIASRAAFKLPQTVRSGAGVTGKFRNKDFSYRIDTNKVAPGEGGFHIHIFRGGKEVAKTTGRGGFVKSHSGQTLLKPSQLPKDVRNDINRLVEHVRRNLD